MTSPSAKPTVLVLCTGNSCRSHMGEAILRTSTTLLNVASAGTKPTGYVHPLAIRVMSEIGIDISSHRSKSVDEFMGKEAESLDIATVITVCGRADQACPVFVGKGGRGMKRFHWGFDDPAHAVGTEEEILAEFRRVRDEMVLVFEAYARGVEEGVRIAGGAMMN